MKEFKSTASLVALLADERNLAISDRDAAARFLRTTNYYRFTGYSRYFQIDPRRGDNGYRPGSQFDEIARLMLLDDELRVRLLVALSELEMSFRARFAHLTGRYLGNGAEYLDPRNFLSDSAETLRRIGKVRLDLVESKSPMVARYRVGEDISALPIWVAVEVLSFGKTTWLLESLKDSRIRRQLADFFGFESESFPRTMHSLANLRNLCAHHGQLWNRKLTIQCPLPLNKRLRPRDVMADPQGIYPAFIALRRLVQGPVAKSHLGSVERRLRMQGLHSEGLLLPQGVR